MNQKLKDLFLGKDYDARQEAFAARLRTEMAAEETALFAGRAVALRTGDTVQINGTRTQGVVRRIMRESDGSLYARVTVRNGEPIEAPAPQAAPVVKAAPAFTTVKAAPAAAVVTVKQEDLPQDFFGKAFRNAGDGFRKAQDAFGKAVDNLGSAMEGSVERLAGFVSRESANLAKAIRDTMPADPVDTREFRDHIINVDRLVKVQKAAAPQPARG